MPEIKLKIGAMDTQGDQSSKDDEVLAHLYNGYRVGTAIHSIPGLLEWLDLDAGNAKIDGDYYSTLHNVRIVVCAGRAWVVTANGVKVELTGLSLSYGIPVTFTEDEHSIFFAAKSNIHKYDGSTLTVMSGQSPVRVTSLSFISGFLVAVGDDSTGDALPGDVWYSDDESYATWEVFNNEALPDAVQTVFTTFSELYAIGRESIEVNYLSTDVSNPFSAQKSASQPFGTPARYSVAFDQQSIYYLTVVGGSRKIVRLVGGRTPEILSFAVDVPIDDIADVSDAKGWIESFKGQSFYCITFPIANIVIGDVAHESLTLAFNLKANEWYVWGEWDGQKSEYLRYPCDTYLYIEPLNKRYIGYRGKIYELTGNSFPDFILRPSLRFGWRSHGNAAKEKICHSYSYDIKRGQSATDQKMQHRWRDNGNMEWKLPRFISLGATGNREVLSKTRQCGRYFKRQDELIFPEGVEMVINGIYENVEVPR